MDYIINPMWFYLMGVSDIAYKVFAILFALSLVAFIGCFCMMIYYRWCAGLKDVPTEAEAREGMHGYSEEYILKNIPERIMRAKRDIEKVNKDYKFFKDLSKITGVISFISVIGLLFIPQKETLIYMLVAKQATYTNVGLTVDAIKEAVDYIVQAISNIR